MTATVDLYVSLHEAGVGVVLDLTAGHLPAVVHWGPDLGPISPEDAAKIVLSGVGGIASNVVDDPVRVALLPEHWTGWVGRPGLRGSRSGADWSTKRDIICTLVKRIEVTADRVRIVFRIDPGSSAPSEPRRSLPYCPTRRDSASDVDDRRGLPLVE